MIYINALELINTSIKHGLLKEEDGKVFVYRKGTSTNPEGWYLDDKDIVAKQLMKDKKGQELFINGLKEKGVEFVPTDYSHLK